MDTATATSDLLQTPTLLHSQTSWTIFETIFSWFKQTSTDNLNSDELISGWQLIISDTEENIIRYQQDVIRKTQEELTILRRISSNVSLKPKFTNYVMTC